MPFTLTFDTNQEASARKYYARKYPEPPTTVVAAPTPVPAAPIVNVISAPSPSPVPVKCPTVAPPLCQRGYQLKYKGTKTDANGCAMPQYICEMMPSTIFGGGGGDVGFEDRMVIKR
jgi:hypothetical protein